MVPVFDDLISCSDDCKSDYSEAADSIDQLESQIEDEINSNLDCVCAPIDKNNNSGRFQPSSSMQFGKMEMGEQDQDSSSFESDFYRCGTDWSSLLRNEDGDNKKRNKNADNCRKLKQANLLQLWGFSNENATIPQPSFEALHDKKTKTTHQSSVANSSSKKRVFKSNVSAKATAATSLRFDNGTTDADTFPGTATSIQQRSQVCPFYKKIPGTAFTVDAFRYGHIKGCTSYFLSHFHADHYGGLSKGWSYGPIYCTPLTARLIRMCLSVNPSFIHSLDIGVEHLIEGVKITMLEANHCPGAALIHFRLSSGQCYLHTGDFRASKLMQDYTLLRKQRINVLYLDTTYCNPKYRFPSKEDVLDFVVRITRISLKRQPKTLVVVGAYSIGKECVYLAISKALGVKIYANASRRRILHSYGWPEISGNLCTDGKETPLHVLPISSLKFQDLERNLKSFGDHYTEVLAFRPTGWTYSENIGSQLDLLKPSRKGRITIYGVPYSEHSSFTELRDFVQFLKPEKIIPTVNVGNAVNRDKMQSYFREWLKG